MSGTLLGDVVDTVAAVSATRSRRAKIDALAVLLARLGADEIPVAIGLLVADPRQGRLGVGWRTLTDETSRDGSPAAPATLTIGDVDAAFDALVAAKGAGSSGIRSGILTDLASRATADEWRLLVQVMLGELRSGALEGVLLEAIARASGRDAVDVRRAAMLSGDLGAAAAIALTGPPEQLTAVGLVVGRPVQPMLAGSAASVAEALVVTGEASVEYKLDGARIQVHRRGDDVRVFTRSLADITARVPEIVATVRGLPVASVILDGETLSLDENGAPRPFQDTMSRFGADAAREVALRPWFFDLLHLDGRDLIDEPLRERRGLLERIAGEFVVPGFITGDADAAEKFSRAALAAGHEGVVVKSVGGAYAAGRRGKNWVKVKPVLTVDLVVLGCEWGSGRRTGLLSNLHLGARDATGEFGGGFVMVGKTFKGLTDELLRWQTERFPKIETHRTAHAVFVEPVTVVEIAIDGVQRSPRYPGGIALRFARVKRYRPDKGPGDADTVQTLRALQRG